MRVACLLMAFLVASPVEASPPDAPAITPKVSRRRAKLISAAVIGAMHAAYATWSYFAWYRDADTKDFFFAYDPTFGVDTYAGGADKLGHCWSNYALTRGTTAVLVAGGWDRLPSSLVAAGLTELAFTLTEIQDGFVFGFEPKDMVANVAGAAAALVMENIPAVDRLFDYRVQYFPSADYRRAFRESNSVDIGQDYSGQSYLLSLHLGALPHAADSDYLYWTRFVDLSVGFEAHHYAPPPVTPTSPPTQTLYVGLSINMQGVLSHVLPDSTGRRIGNGAFEVFALPYTTFRYFERSRSR